MRTLNGAAVALFSRMAAGERIGWVQLVEIQLSTTLRVTTAGRAVTWDGQTWAPSGLGTVEPVNDVAGDVVGLSFTMPGISSGDIALVITEPVEGKTVRVWDALVDPDTGVVADAVLAWAGTLNVPALDDGGTAVVSVSAEHRALQALRSKPSRYTDDEQQRLYPGDTCLQFDPATDAAPIAWPLASFFKK